LGDLPPDLLLRRTKFSNIGRHRFNACLRQAWAGAKSTVRIAATSAEAKADRITTLTDAIELERFNDHWSSARARIAAMRTAIATVQIRRNQSTTA
jgi:hypothetical protein